MEASLGKQADGLPEPAGLRWIFRGNIVVPTGNPFHPPFDAPPTSSEGTGPSCCEWLGPGLKLLLDHVLTVDQNGMIRDLEPAESFLALQQSKDETNANTNTRAGQPIQQLHRNEFLCPGMVDLHIHAPQYAYTGTATDRPLMGQTGWLETYTFPAERRLKDDRALADSVYDGVVRTTLRHGTTTAVYFATLDVEPCKVLVEAALQRGQRALIGKVCMDRNSPEDYCQPLEQNLEEAKAVIEYIHSRVGKRQRQQGDQKLLPRILPLITPRFLPTCSPALLTALGEMAAKYDCHVTSHLSESLDEVAFSRHLDATQDLGDGVGRTDAAIFDSHSLLTDQCIMAHSVHLTDSDCTLLKQRGSAIAHCPLSNMFFAGGILPCRRLLQSEIKVGLGTDVAGGYSPSLLNSSRMTVVAAQALQQHHQRTPTSAKESAVLDYRHAFYLATLGGATALGLQHRIGTLAVGMEFDAIVLSAGSAENGAAYSPVQVFDSDTLSDMFQKLCVLGDDRNVKRVFVQGVEVTQR